VAGAAGLAGALRTHAGRASHFLLLSSLELSDTKVYEPQIRALLGAGAEWLGLQDSLVQFGHTLGSQPVLSLALHGAWWRPPELERLVTCCPGAGAEWLGLQDSLVQFGHTLGAQVRLDFEATNLRRFVYPPLQRERVPGSLTSSSLPSRERVLY